MEQTKREGSDWREKCLAVGLHGPWENEPDRLEFRSPSGTPCIVRRGLYGAWCGYAAVVPGHPLYGRSGDDLEVHGGVTYGQKCAGEVCHVPLPGEPDDVFWFGFDCAHAGDLIPGMEALRLEWRREEPERWARYDGLLPGDTYRDLSYVRAETLELAAQLEKLA